jgi:hypothetical protein
LKPLIPEKSEDRTPMSTDQADPEFHVTAEIRSGVLIGVHHVFSVFIGVIFL